MQAVPREHITGLVLAGGRGQRLGGVDKGLQTVGTQPLAQWALERLRPQVGALAISANRHLDTYRGFGVPVWPDAQAGHPGPLAGLLAGLTHCTTPWLVTVPCDTPHFPADLVARLAAALVAEGAELALAATREAGRLQPQPVFALLPRTLADDLARSLAAGTRGIERWAAGHRCAHAVFDDAAAFFNANTPDELRRLQETR